MDETFSLLNQQLQWKQLFLKQHPLPGESKTPNKF